MDKLLRLKERVEIAIELGESYYREFKSGFEGPPSNKKQREIKDICYNIGKELVAFANAGDITKSCGWGKKRANPSV